MGIQDFCMTCAITLTPNSSVKGVKCEQTHEITHRQVHIAVSPSMTE